MTSRTLTCITATPLLRLLTSKPVGRSQGVQRVSRLTVRKECGAEFPARLRLNERGTSLSKIACLIVITAAFSRSAVVAQSTPTTGSTKLLALYSFNGTLADSSGNGRTAHDSGTPTYVTGAPFGGKAISFNGSGKAIVTAPLNISITALKQVTFGGWVKALSIATPQYGVISNDDGDFDRSIDIDTRPTGTPSWSAFVGGNVVGKVPVVVGKWYFVAVSFNQSTLPGRYAFYVNDGIKTRP